MREPYEKMKLKPCLAPHAKTYSGCIVDPKLKGKTITHFEGNMENVFIK